MQARNTKPKCTPRFKCTSYFMNKLLLKGTEFKPHSMHWPNPGAEFYKQGYETELHILVRKLPLNHKFWISITKF